MVWELLLQTLEPAFLCLCLLCINILGKMNSLGNVGAAAVQVGAEGMKGLWKSKCKSGREREE